MMNVQAIPNQIDWQDLFQRQREASRACRTEPLSSRITRLKALKRWILKNRLPLKEAAMKDLRKPFAEFEAVEIVQVLGEIKTSLNNLSKWTSLKHISSTLPMLGTTSFSFHEPKGVCLILSPWNVPFSLAVSPLVSALTAGNTVIIKPSELSPAMSAQIERMVTELFPSEVVAVVQGDAEVSKALLTLPFSHIFFTGSTNVGKYVMKAAAEHLASVTLELGGKCPTIVSASANLKDAARRIVIAKWVNAGQTCIAPDYLLVDKKIVTPLIDLMVENINNYFLRPDNKTVETANMGKIISSSHFRRLKDLVAEAKSMGWTSLLEGFHNDEENIFFPTVLMGGKMEARIMQEEIFGPILPIIEIDSLSDAFHRIEALPKPLSLYLFSTSKEEQKRTLYESTSGGICFNECSIQYLHPHYPFGGVGPSGFGKSHGYAGFCEFSNEKPILKQKQGFTPIQLFYPPYRKRTDRLINLLLRLFY